MKLLIIFFFFFIFNFSFETIIKKNILFLVFFQPIPAFNIDSLHPVLKQGPKGSFFGYSSELHFIFESPQTKPRPIILVGAPKQITTLKNGNRVSSGALFSCPFSSLEDDCKKIELKTGLDENEVGDQWLGATLVSQKSYKGSVLVCAPRFKIKKPGMLYSQGMCLHLSNLLKTKEYLEPCSGLDLQDFGFCQAGLSADINLKGEVVLGAPGIRAWSGSVFHKNLYTSIDQKNKWIFMNKSYLPVKFYSYLGMSVKIGRINSPSSVVVGAPRSMAVGQVFLLEKEMDSLVFKEHLTGFQMGSGFGYVVEMVDFNNDGLDDLVVSAPFEFGTGYNGAVYIYQNSYLGINKNTIPKKIMNKKFSEVECSLFNCLNARFGLSLANIGDIDGDSFQDLAIGAPYQGNGIVYIYQGGKDGLESNYSQSIYPLQTWGTIKTFGYSISGGLDIDRNGNDDIIIGSYASDKVMIFRSRPVIVGKASLKQNPDLINFRLCKEKEPCLNVTSCLQFADINSIPKNLILHFEMILEADAKKKQGFGRLFFYNNHSKVQEIFIVKKLIKSHCHNMTLFLDNKKQNFHEPVNFKLSYRIIPHFLASSSRYLPYQINFNPILNRGRASISKMIFFKKNCDNQEVCLSNLKLSAQIEKTNKTSQGETIVKVGEKKEISMLVDVQNYEEEAHCAMLFVFLPESIKLKGTDETGKRYSCDYKRNTISCNLGNPMPGGTEVSFCLRLDITQLYPNQENHLINLFVNTTSWEVQNADNLKTIPLKVVVEAELEVIGSSQPLELFIGAITEKENKNTENNKLTVTHSYEVKNMFGGKIGTSELKIRIPTDPLLRLFFYSFRTQTEDNVVCSFLNESRFEIEKNKRQFLKNRIGSESFLLDCTQTSTKCVILKCSVSELEEGKSAVIQLFGEIWKSSFLKLRKVNKVKICSSASLSLNSKFRVFQGNLENDFNKTCTLVSREQNLNAPPSVDLWIVLVSVSFGLLFLFFLLLFLYSIFKKESP